MKFVRGWTIAALVAASLSIAGVGAASESASALVDLGLAAYERGDFEASVNAFGEAVAQGIEDPVVHYNLGNAHFKAGRLGPAIWHWRKAHSLAPRDEDIAANLEYGRFLALDRVEGEEAAPVDRRVERWLDRITADEAARIAAGLWALAGVAAVAWQLAPVGRGFWRRTALALTVLWALSFAGAWAADRRDRAVREAVVLAREAEIRSEPAASSATAFVLHEGAEVVVEGERVGWTEISLTGDLRGWIRSDQIAQL